MLHATGISRHHGGQVVLDRVSVSITERTRIGLVGPNGIGKSTLLRILAGLETPDAGRVERAPASTTVGYLPQEPDAAPGETLIAYLARRTGVAAAEAELDRRTAALSDTGDAGDAVDAYTLALERFLALGGDDLAARAGAVCAEVGLVLDDLGVEVRSLSGGQAARAALAAILLSKFDVLLLDEPTNNLDFAGLDTLERFVGGLPGGVVVVSHDRSFLDRTVTRIVEIEEGTHRAVEYAGGWNEFVEARALARGQQYEAHAKFQAERARLLERQRTQRSWADNAAGRARRKATDNDKAQRDFRVNRTEKQAAKVRATERKLAHLDAVDKPWEGWRLELALTPSARSGDVVARLEEAVIERPNGFRLGPLDLELRWQERLAILGPNGSGKSTLIQALLGALPLSAGRRWLGPGVVVGEMDQARHAVGASPVLDSFLARTGLTQSEARSLLAKFGIGADHVGRPGDALSPGERSRVILAALMAAGVNCLVLDEPTNHLDLEAIEQLEAALDGFAGTLVLVSHDRRLLEAVHLTRTVELG